MRGFPSGLALLAAAVVVAACTTPPPNPDTPRPGTTVLQPTPASGARVKVEPPPAPEVASRPAPAEPAVAPEPEPEPLPEPGELSGLDAEAIQKRLGEPVFARTDPPAALWQYRQGGCVLDLYLFEIESRLSVRHFEFRSDPRQTGADTDAPLDIRKCYAALIRAQDARAGR